VSHRHVTFARTMQCAIMPYLSRFYSVSHCILEEGLFELYSAHTVKSCTRYLLEGIVCSVISILDISLRSQKEQGSEKWIIIDRELLGEILLLHWILKRHEYVRAEMAWDWGS